jgi:hypothetical protein
LPCFIFLKIKIPVLQNFGLFEVISVKLIGKFSIDQKSNENENENENENSNERKIENVN